MDREEVDLSMESCGKEQKDRVQDRADRLCLFHNLHRLLLVIADKTAFYMESN